jgi:hypothetical protein
VLFQYAPLMSEVNSESSAVSFKAVALASAGQGLTAKTGCAESNVVIHSQVANLRYMADTIRNFHGLAN